MTIAQATEATAFIVHRALREMAIAALVNGRTFICPDCGNIASTETGCSPCDDVMFASLCAEHDAHQADRDWWESEQEMANFTNGRYDN